MKPQKPFHNLDQHLLQKGFTQNIIKLILFDNFKCTISNYLTKQIIRQLKENHSDMIMQMNFTYKTSNVNATNYNRI